MTVTTPIAEFEATGNDANTTFPTGIYLIENDELVVNRREILTGLETLLVLNTDYTLSNVGEPAGVTVTYPISGSPLPPTHKIIVTRDVPYTQDSVILNARGFLPSVIEEALDRTVMMIQGLRAIVTGVKADLDTAIAGGAFNMLSSGGQAIEDIVENVMNTTTPVFQNLVTFAHDTLFQGTSTFNGIVDFNDSVTFDETVSVNADWTWTGRPFFQNKAVVDMPWPEMILDADSGNGAQFIWKKGSLDRYRAGISAEAETGSNAGSNFRWSRYDDAGVFIEDNLVLNRADGGLFLNGRGDATGGWFTASDRSLKEDEKIIENAMDIVFSWNGYDAYMKEPKARGYVLMADEVELMAPHMVKERIDGKKVVNYDAGVPILTEAFKEHVRAQEAKIMELETRLLQLENPV